MLNVDGYYDSLLALFDKGVEQGFIEDSARHIVASAESAEELLRKMEVGGRRGEDGESAEPQGLDFAVCILLQFWLAAALLDWVRGTKICRGKAGNDLLLSLAGGCTT